MKDVALEHEELPEGTTATLEEERAAEELGERPAERNMGARSSQVAGKVIVVLGQHVGERKLGKVFAPDCGYHLPSDDAKRVRFPDVSFVACGRLEGERTPEGYLKLAPDLALEVVSPNDSAYEVEEKRVAYLRAGVRLLWVVYPPTRTVFVFRLTGSVAVLGEGDTLSGEDVLPDFSCPVARFFEDL